MNVLIAVIGVVLSILSTIAIFILNGIKSSQDNTNKEIKEMNKDIREVIVSNGKNDERIIGLFHRVDMLHDTVKSLDSRVLYIEQN
jgi:hypothetical protein